MQTADEILEKAKRLPPAERRRIAEELLDQLDHADVDEAKGKAPDKGPYARWLEAAGTVRSDFSDLSTDKYEHVAAAVLHGHDKP
jgi:hypothetical protein